MRWDDWEITPILWRITHLVYLLSTIKPVPLRFVVWVCTRIVFSLHLHIMLISIVRCGISYVSVINIPLLPELDVGKKSSEPCLKTMMSHIFWLFQSVFSRWNAPCLMLKFLIFPTALPRWSRDVGLCHRRCVRGSMARGANRMVRAS